MPFRGPHFRTSPNVKSKDGRLSGFSFSDMCKIRVLSYAVRSHGGFLEDAGIKHYRAREVTIVSNPQMPYLSTAFPYTRVR